MTTLITGGSKCGKSRLAERVLSGFDGRKIYLATMQPYGSDDLKQRRDGLQVFLDKMGW